MPEKKHSTRIEMEERVEMTARLLAKGLYKGQVKAAIIGQYAVSARMAETYISRARCKLLAETGRPKIEHRAESYAVYAEIRQTAKQDIVRLKAQERIDKLFGLEEATEVRHSGHTTADVTSGGKELATADERRVELAALVAVLRERAGIGPIAAIAPHANGTGNGKSV